MNTTPATPPALPAEHLSATADRPPRFPFLLLFIVWFAIVLVGTLVTFILPEYFASTTRIKIGSDQPNIRAFAQPANGTNAFDPYFFQTEFETIQSEVVLIRVIDKLNLNSVWGQKYLDGGKLKTSETLVILRGRLDIRPVRNTSLLDIRAFSENPNEARDIANTVAEMYRTWRHDQFFERGRDSLKSLEERAKLADAQVNMMKQQLDEPAGTAGGTEKPDFSEKQKELDEAIAFRSELIRRLRLEEVDLHLPRSGQVMVLERAVASAKPFRPNKPLNIVVGIIVGAVAGFLLATLVYAINYWAHQRRTGNSGTNTLRGLRTFTQVSVALFIGILVGYNCAMPWSRASLLFTFVFVVLGALAIGYVAIAKTTPLPPKAGDRLGST